MVNKRGIGVEKLRVFLNSMPTKEQEEYAKKCGTTIGYLRKALSVGTKLDGALARRLDVESSGKVPKESVRPDIWPELLQQE